MGAWEAVDARYRPIWERMNEVLGTDPRVIRLGVYGSIAAGTADRWSDLDVAVVVEPDHHATLLAEWPGWLEQITPTVFARTPIAPFIINAVTPDGLTLDITVWSGEPHDAPSTTPFTVGMLAGTRFDTISPALEYAVAEQLRGLAGPFVSLLQREEHVRHLMGVPHLVGLLMTVFLAETGRPPAAKRYNDTLTDEQRATIAALPAVSASREGLMSFGLAVGHAVIERARPLFARYDIVWPHELEAVAARRLQAELGVDTSAWLRC